MKKVRKIWIDGDTLVRKDGERQADDYLHGSGYQAKLTVFINQRDAKLKEEEQRVKALKLRKPTKKTDEAGIEPGA